jgi:hypothetical protein
LKNKDIDCILPIEGLAHAEERLHLADRRPCACRGVGGEPRYR